MRSVPSRSRPSAFSSSRPARGLVASACSTSLRRATCATPWDGNRRTTCSRSRQPLLPPGRARRGAAPRGTPPRPGGRSRRRPPRRPGGPRRRAGVRRGTARWRRSSARRPGRAGAAASALRGRTPPRLRPGARPPRPGPPSALARSNAAPRAAPHPSSPTIPSVSARAFACPNGLREDVRRRPPRRRGSRRGA